MPVTVTSSGTLTELKVQASTDDSTTDVSLTTAEVDRLIGELAEIRAKMAPAHTGRIGDETAAPFQADNLLWETFPDRALRGVVLALNHAGLGWIAVRLSRAQIEDLVTSFEFSLSKLMIPQQGGDTSANNQTAAKDKTA